MKGLLNAYLTLDADGARAAARAAEAAVVRGTALGPLHGLPVSIKDLEPSAGIRCTCGSKHGQALLARTAFYGQVQRFFARYDLLLTPQLPIAAWSIDRGPSEIDGRATPTMFHRLGFTLPFNLTGQPGASDPCGFTPEGLPVAPQIVGRWHADALVLQAAAAYEQAVPWAQLRPPVGSPPVEVEP